ncbi:MAG: methionyl-tRNA formyltransferase [Flavobacteriales bacterium]|nr:methionyl-tRNA formyltransferase [Flavobacteriales bacterium]
MKVVFMGTPEFAVATLAAIQSSNHNVVGVITAPDKPSGRGQKMKFSAVKDFALEHELKVLQPKNLKDSDFVQSLNELEADIFVVVAFRMLPKAVWALPKKGTINLHASLLPSYRGAAPINWAIINGETLSGVTTFFINEKIDTGDILLQKECAINHDMNAGRLHDELMSIGADLVIETLDQIEQDNISPISQDLSSDEYPKAPKIFRETCQINWSTSAMEIYNFIRGLSPYPRAWTEIIIDGSPKVLKISEASIVESDQTSTLIVSDKAIMIKAKDNYISLLEVQLEGKKKMSVSDFLNGMKGKKIELKKA